jgi:sterol desaturase/sphingolipid hydroxylase (fatty acid hydroxylase superfamily)
MLVVTPDVHRVHHSSNTTDFMKNFGIVFTCWDRLAGTYRPPVGNGPSNFGLDTAGRPAGQSLGRLLVMPLSRMS